MGKYVILKIGDVQSPNFLYIGKQKFTLYERLNDVDYKQLINERGIKQQFLADKLGISKTMMSLFLSGKKNLSPEKISMLNKLLNVKEE
ncbi:helix-turn-helix transcriptional regulator [Paenibacillus cremeus]|uniref:Helix-turn-helix transcriptional regulator n=1 Tax=Paenibacillus cremeus TaxID=2163881 RepID=A0A559KCU2_9BACL|nr:helix-turn-helix transcriptional regulator [Paenibacillus cremeus]